MKFTTETVDSRSTRSWVKPQTTSIAFLRDVYHWNGLCEAETFTVYSAGNLAKSAQGPFFIFCPKQF